MYATIEQILGREKQHNDERFLYNIKEWYNYSKIDFDKDIFYKPWSKHKIKQLKLISQNYNANTKNTQSKRRLKRGRADWDK